MTPCLFSPESRAVHALSALWVAALVVHSTPSAQAEEKKIRFNRDIRPILSDNCFSCHGFDQKTRKADRRLDTRDGAMAEKDGVRAMVPGDLKASEMHTRIYSSDPDEVMPPAKDGKKLTPEQKVLLDEWIKQGAPYEEHWAYVAPVKVELSPGQGPVDALVQKRLAQNGLQAAPQADRRTLVRRLYFDLLGLPPTPEEVIAFEQDPATDAYERLVERLLASPHYGERMALPWLDAVRFADTIGYHSDNPRNVWPYRDYVIRSFNENKAFDQFTREQLAGDLLPSPTLEQRVASGFNRLILSTEEGGAQPKDYEARMLTDRVRALGTVWLGQTIGCAQCHDHKFDPISTRDFYTLGAFFADVKEGAIGRREDGMVVPTAEEEARLGAFARRIAGLEADLAATSVERDQEQTEWERTFADGVPDVVWEPLVPVKTYADRGSKLIAGPDGTIDVALDGDAASDTYFVTVKTPPGTTTGFRLEALASDLLPGKGPGRSGTGNFILGKFTVKEQDTVLKIAEATATYEQKGFTAKQAIDDKSKDGKNGWAVLGNTGKDNAIYFEMVQPIEGEKTLTLLLRQVSGDNQTLGKFRLQATQAPKPIRAPNVQFPADIVAIIKLAPEKRNAGQRAKLAKHFRNVAPQFAPLRQQIADEQVARLEYEKSLPHCLVTVSSDKPRTVRILPRGDWQNETGEVVQPAVLHFLPQPKVEGRALNRLDLADWLVSPSNPLTARVFVNRLWKQFFGMGLSKVLDDLGAQGEPPIHAELLDWLACEFRDSGWDVKHIVRLLVRSQAYRQVSTAARDGIVRDPYNRELARQSRWRLDAELVRDNALSVSGLLVSRIGGPSVKPYQPAGYWENLNFPARTYQNDSGPDQYRRGLYTWWQRSYVHPSMLAFDAPTREECTAERTRSNIPQQALVLLNDPTYVEAARSLAARIVADGGGSVASRLEWAFRRVLQRAPQAEEARELEELLKKHLAEFDAAPEAVEKLLSVGNAKSADAKPTAELAAWTSIARVLLNLHETITRS